MGGVRVAGGLEIQADESCICSIEKPFSQRSRKYIIIFVNTMNYPLRSERL